MSKPSRTASYHVLPFLSLSSDDFERLSLWLVEREGFSRVQHLGAAGKDQGRDILAFRDGEQWAFQCKRVKSFEPKQAESEVAKLKSLPESEQPDHLVIVSSCNLSAATRNRCSLAAAPIRCSYWALTELDEKVKRHGDLLREFFALPFGSVGRTSGASERPWMVPFEIDAVDGVRHTSALADSYLRDFVGREWLPEVVGRWTSQIFDRNVLVISGPPGSGKSTIAAAIATKNVGPTSCLGFHFCSAGRHDSVSAVTTVPLLAHCIGEKLPTFKELLDRKYGEMLDPVQCFRDPVSAFEKGVLAALRDLPIQRRSFLVVDAVNECAKVSSDHASIFDVLCDTLHMFPSWLGLIVTTTNENQVITRLSSVGRVTRKEIGLVENESDIRSFVCQSIRTPEMQKRLMESAINETSLVDSLCEASNGNFMFAKASLAGFADGSWLPDSEEDVPQSLNGAYDSYFRHQFGKHADDYSEPRLILETILAAGAPLSYEQLELAVEPELLASTSFAVAMTKLRRFLVEDGYGLSVFHQSLRDWLTNAQHQFRVYPKRAEQRILRMCWDEFLHPGNTSEFVLRYLPRLLQKHDRWSDVVRVLTDFEFTQAKVQAGLALELSDDFVATVTQCSDDVMLVNNTKREHHVEVQLEIIRLLSHALVQDIAFVSRYPKAYFQCIWNRCWWIGKYDPVHYEISTSDPTKPDVIKSLAYAAVGGLILQLIGIPVLAVNAGQVVYFLWTRGVYKKLFNKLRQITIERTDSATVGRTAIQNYLLKWRQANAQKDRRPWMLSVRPLGRAMKTTGSITATIGYVKAIQTCGKDIAIGAGDSIRIVDSTNGRVKFHFRDVGSARRGISFIAISKDESVAMAIAVGGSFAHGHHSQFLAWRAASGSAPVFSLSVEINPFKCCLTSCVRGNIALVSSLNSGAFVLVDIEQQTERLVRHGFEGIRCSALSPSGCVFAAVPENNFTSGPTESIIVYDATNGEVKFQLNGHRSSVNCIAFSGDGNTIVSGSDDSTIRVWNVAKRTQTRVIRTGNFLGTIEALCVARDRPIVACVNSLRQAFVWNYQTGRLLTAIPHDGLGVTEIQTLAISDDGRNIYFSNKRDNVIQCVRIDIEQPKYVLRDHDRHIKDIVVSNDGNVAASSDQFTVKVWDLTSGKCLLTAANQPYRRAALSKDGKRVAVVQNRLLRSVARVYSTQTRRIERTISCSYGSSVALLPDGRTLLIGERDYIVGHKIENGSEIYRLKNSEGHVDYLAVSPNGSRLASSGDKQSGGPTRIWDLETRKRIRSLDADDLRPEELRFSADGRFLHATGFSKADVCKLPESVLRSIDAANFGKELSLIVSSEQIEMTLVDGRKISWVDATVPADEYTVRISASGQSLVNAEAFVSWTSWTWAADTGEFVSRLINRDALDAQSRRLKNRTEDNHTVFTDESGTTVARFPFISEMKSHRFAHYLPVPHGRSWVGAWGRQFQILLLEPK